MTQDTFNQSENDRPYGSPDSEPQSQHDTGRHSDDHIIEQPEEQTGSATRHKIDQIYEQMAKVVVGQRYMIDRLLIGLFTDGHILLEGVPGLAKTLTINTLSKVLHLDFQRIQFTPDLLPADLIGTMVYNQRESNFEVKKGPVFSNLILADEVNRSPAKVQSALLEAMQEKQVTIGETTFKLDRPFLVLATQNPVEQEGTYPLPEAQMDRFMMKLYIDYPTKEEEMTIMRRMASIAFKEEVAAVLTREDIFAIRKEIDQISLSEALEEYIVELVFATRQPAKYNLEQGKEYIQFGASPRATISMHRAARAVAYLNGRDFVLPEDIKEIAPDVMNHRIILNYEAEADGIGTRQIIDEMLNKIAINNYVS